MKYEKTRKEFYKDELNSMAEEIAQILDNGYSVEIARSRSGLKMFSISKKHVVVRRDLDNASK